MWNKGFRLLWFKLQTDKNKQFGLSFPIPMYIFQDLLDCTLDFFTVMCFFVPKTNQLSSSTTYGIYAMKELVEITMKLLDSITQGDPYDLVDVTADKVRVFIKVR